MIPELYKNFNIILLSEKNILLLKINNKLNNKIKNCFLKFKNYLKTLIL